MDKEIRKACRAMTRAITTQFRFEDMEAKSARAVIVNHTDIEAMARAAIDTATHVNIDYELDSVGAEIVTVEQIKDADLYRAIVRKNVSKTPTATVDNMFEGKGSTRAEAIADACNAVTRRSLFGRN